MKYTIKNVYGREQIYPACELSREFLRIHGLKVFTPAMIQTCKLLGVKLEQVVDLVVL